MLVQVRIKSANRLFCNLEGRVVARLIEVLFPEQNYERAPTRRYMMLETLGAVSEAAVISLPAVAA